MIRSPVPNIREIKRPTSSSAKKSSIQKLNRISNYHSPSDPIKVLGKHHLSQGLHIEEFDTKSNFHNSSAYN